MAEETWHEARLIPTSGIDGVEEQERRATSALLAVMTAVKEFGRALTQTLGAPAGALARTGSGGQPSIGCGATGHVALSLDQNLRHAFAP